MSNVGTSDQQQIKLQSSNSTLDRESLITTAINFLQNPSVRHSSLSKKQSFLRSKGLTEDEIQIACEKAGVFTLDPNNSTVISMGISTSSSSSSSSSSQSNGSHSHLIVQQKPSIFSQIKEIFNAITFYSTFAYLCYLFYKKYIEPFLFGTKKKKTLEEINEQIEIQIKEVNQEITRIREEITQNNSITREMNNFKNDLDVIKGLLLNRKQFANPSSLQLPILSPSIIPSWQLTSQTHRTETETEPDKSDDAGSGSGSSETVEVVTNSDNSLEIM